jgi:hypothetical protein
MRMLALSIAAVLLSSLAAADGAETAWPDALPPLNDALVAPDDGDDTSSPVRAFVQARVRGELDDSRDLARRPDASVGSSLTGRVGAEAVTGPARALVVVGDGGRVGQPPTAPILVPTAPVRFLYVAELSVDVRLFGLPAEIAVGRMPFTLADERLVGAEPFDARGRSFDGARVRLRGGVWDAGIMTALFAPRVDAPTISSSFAVADLRLRPVEAVQIAAYAVFLRDHVQAAPSFPMVGARVHAHAGERWRVDVDAGGDVQAAIDGGRSLSPSPGRSGVGAGVAGHGEIALRGSARLGHDNPVTLDPFVALSAELTGGDVVEGRVFRQPAPTQHGALGVLDLFAWDNTWSAAAAIGGFDDEGLVLQIGGRAVGLLDPAGPLVDPVGRPVLSRRVGEGGLAFLEGAAGLEVRAAPGVRVAASYALGAPGAALIGDTVAQRLLVSCTIAVDRDGEVPVPPLR